MVRLLLPAAAGLAACTAAPQNEAATASSSATPAAAQVADPGENTRPAPGGAAAAAVGPSAEPVSAAANPLPARHADTAAEAEGRRTLSTAFVRVGPDGLLTVERRGGQPLILRDVVMGPSSYCGQQAAGSSSGSKYCGSYAEVLAARPGGAPPAEQPDLSALNPLNVGK